MPWKLLFDLMIASWTQKVSDQPSRDAKALVVFGRCLGLLVVAVIGLFIWLS